MEMREHVIGYWRKDNPCYEVAENLTELSEVLTCLLDRKETLDIYLRRFSREMWKVQHGFSFAVYDKM